MSNLPNNFDMTPENQEPTNNKKSFKLKVDKFIKKFKKKPIMDSKKSDIIYQLIWLTPALFFILLFSYFSIFIVFRFGFNGADDDINDFMFSLINFKQVIKDTEFTLALNNTLLYVIVVVPISLFISLITAWSLSRVLNKKIFSWLQAVFFLPYVTSSIAIAMSFTFFFADGGGLLNQLLNLFGVDSVKWSTPGKSIIILLVYGVWHSLPFKIIMFTGAFLRIDNRYFHAASVDGVPKWKQFYKISLPQLTPMIIYMVTTGLIGGFKVMPIGLFANYQAALKSEATTIAFYIFSKARDLTSVAKTGAASIILMALILALTIFNRIVSKYVQKKFS